MRLALLFILLLPVCLAKPFHQMGLFDFMLEDEGSADMAPTDDPVISGFGPVCPFRCQCHLRVVQCSDLGKPWSVSKGSSHDHKICLIFYVYFMYAHFICSLKHYRFLFQGKSLFKAIPSKPY